MAKFLLRPKALDDLDSIWNYTVIAWGEEQAERYIRSLNRGFETLAEEPSRGRSCNSIRRGYFKHRVGQHIIFFRVLENGDVDVVRVLHGSMDLPTKMGEEDF